MNALAPRIRRYFVWQHRWVGLALTFFLIVIGITGSLLAYREEIDRLLNPDLYARPIPGARPLDLATLAERAEAIDPHARVWYFYQTRNDHVSLRCVPRTDPATGKPFDIDYDHLILDPITGREIARLKTYGARSFGRRTFMSYVYDLHTSVMCGGAGWNFLGYVAVLWVLDCFVGFYLTLPIGWTQFWTRWTPAWQVRWGATLFRRLFDLHRAPGLWLWPMLFVFAWSGVMFNCRPVYERVTHALFDYKSEMDELPMPTGKVVERPRLGWREALRIAEQRMEDVAGRRGFWVDRAVGFAYIAEVGMYNYTVLSSLDFRRSPPGTDIMIDGNTGELKAVMLPRGEHAGNTIGNLLWGLHYGDLYGWSLYRLFVAVFGWVVVLLSLTGVYIWWRKRRRA
ncbi:MAG TPA: hypothetical protein DCM86_14545 [Verrucomicrobiales bacterium]|nr:hypothetical protein [Verrucomicrobiales bacterium]